MIGNIGNSAAEKFTVLSTRPAGDYSNIIQYLRALAANDLQVVFLDHMSKIPAKDDLRTSRQRSADEDAARAKAQAEGDPRWALKTVRPGIELATSDIKRLEHYHKAWVKSHPNGDMYNLAVAVENMVVVDADQREGVEAFQDMYLQATGEQITPTVLTPGVQDEDGQWRHRDGAHFYFTLPDGYELPPEVNRIAAHAGTPAEFDIFFGSRYILIPPSVRKEGPYRWVGDVREAPRGLLEAAELRASQVREARQAQAERAALREIEGPSAIDAWAARHDWAEFLEPDGYHNIHTPKGCGCPQYTAPGVHASPQSCVAHEPGCAYFDTTSGHGPLHWFTTNMPEAIHRYEAVTGCSSMTMFQYAAWTRFDGDEAAAARGLGIGGGGQAFGTVADYAHLLKPSGSVTAPVTAPVTPPVTPTVTPTVTAPVDDAPTATVTPITAQPKSDDEADPNSLVMPGTRHQMTRAEYLKLSAVSADDKNVYPRGFPYENALIREIFEYSDQTRAILHAARALRGKKAPPVAVLLRVLQMFSARCPVDTRLDGIPHGTYVIVVGRSGTAKSTATNVAAMPFNNLQAPGWLADIAAEQVVPFDDDGKPLAPIAIPYDFDRSIEIGSGQAAAGLLVVKDRKTGLTEMRPHAEVNIFVDEYSGLLAAASSESSSLIATLNTMYSGKPFGNTTRTHGTTRVDGDYIVNLFGGLQPMLGWRLKQHADSGNFQRNWLTSATDLYAPLGEPRVAQPMISPQFVMPHISKGDQFTADDSVWDEVEALNLTSYMDHPADSEIEEMSHMTVQRLRLAMQFALMHGTLHVSQASWDWTALMQEHHMRVKAWLDVEIEATADDKAADGGRQRATEEASRRSHSAIQTSAVKKRVLKLLVSGARYESDLLNNITKSKRAYLTTALAELLGGGWIVKHGAKYALAPSVTKEAVDEFAFDAA